MKRRANIDLLKVLAMLGIILFHHFATKIPNHFVELTEGFTNDSYFYDFINNIPGAVAKTSLLMDFCYGHFGNGCNLIFMTITGFFLFGREISFPDRVRKAGYVLYAILFHGIVLTLINYLLLKFFYPFSSYPSYHLLFTLPNWFSGENLWYLQAYGLFILLILPILKLFERKLTQTTHLCLALTLLFINFLAYSKYFPNIWFSQKMLDFTMCYYIGGYISKYDVQINLKKLVVLICIYLIAYFAYEYYWRYSCAIQYAPTSYSYIKVMQPFICCIIFALLNFLFFNSINTFSEKSSKILKKNGILNNWNLYILLLF